MVSETTPLTGGTPNYVFQKGFPFLTRSKHFNCCIGALCLALLITVLVIVISVIGIRVGQDIEDSIQSGEEALVQRDETEKQMAVLQTASPSFRHQMSTATTSRADQIGRNGYGIYYASKWMGKARNHGKANPLNEVCSKALENTDWCMKKKKSKCFQTRYRSIDGTCNNLVHPDEWGVAYTKFFRPIPPAYEDGVGEPRGGITGGELPSASVVSRLVHRPAYKNDPNFTVMLAVWGQFIDHDITATALSRGQKGEAISCCGQRMMHPECFPVIEKLEDGSERCMDFVRSAPAASCCLGVREQLNQVTAFLDGSVIYGSDRKLTSELRTFKQGALKMLSSGPVGKYLLPISTNPNDGCNRKEMSDKGRYCFISGDGRANENLFLTTMHLIWARQHNRLASQLSQLNPNWNDETIYQETRHIIAAQIQHITFTEFLPIVLGRELINKHSLNSLESGYFYEYNVSVSASIINSFAAAAFRFAHTLIPGMYKKFKADNSTYEFFKLHQMLFNPFRIYDELDNILQETIINNIEKSDPYFTEELKEHLFEQPTETPKHGGLDLVALNIQRGRDHGLPGYVHYRQYCQLSVPKSFTDLLAMMDSNSVDVLSKLYKTVEDIDLYTGALSEQQLPEGLVGPTASCLITKQFKIVKFSDRYWYETPEQPQAFTIEQLNEIKQTTLSSIICQNSDDMKYVPKWVMRTNAELQNDIVLCDDISGPNLTFWKEL